MARNGWWWNRDEARMTPKLSRGDLFWQQMLANAVKETFGEPGEGREGDSHRGRGYL
jgi:hypothetical protein